MKQHSDSVHRDLDDEVAEAIEHQYAQKLMRRSGNAPPTERRRHREETKPDDGDINADVEQLHGKSRP
jgi:hypothetical protein